MKPLLPKEPIEAVFLGGCTGYVVAAKTDGRILFMFDCEPHSTNSNKWYEKEIFENPSPTLLAFIAEAQAYFKPLVELPITFDELADCWASIFGKDHLEQWGTALPFEKALMEKGFKCKESA